MNNDKKPEPLKGVLNKIISNLKKKEEYEAGIIKLWEKTVGKSASKHARPAFLRAKRLVVNVSDSSWLYKLTLEKDSLLRRFNENLKSRRKVRELQFRIGQIK
ncbi:MAG: hypothetical protein A2Z72_06040 [Omnitrophica bacterium RBG_13_46_9]|nr:MAG: hypothetical protein A2Z72_06040 [Omnitrophica bacterium RBG_13_46_9]